MCVSAPSVSQMPDSSTCDLELVCSPTCAINLDPETATQACITHTCPSLYRDPLSRLHRPPIQAGVPLAARHFFYCFGGFQCDERVTPAQLSLEAAKETGEWEVEAVAALVQRGGFVYLDEAGKVLQANIEVPKDDPRQ